MGLCTPCVQHVLPIVRPLPGRMQPRGDSGEMQDCWGITRGELRGQGHGSQNGEMEGGAPTGPPEMGPHCLQVGAAQPVTEKRGVGAGTEQDRVTSADGVLLRDHCQEVRTNPGGPAVVHPPPPGGREPMSGNDPHPGAALRAGRRLCEGGARPPN